MTPEQLATLVQVFRDAGPVGLALVFGWIAWRFFLENKEKDAKIAAMYEDRLDESRVDRKDAVAQSALIVAEMGKFREVMERYERRIEPR